MRGSAVLKVKALLTRKLRECDGLAEIFQKLSILPIIFLFTSGTVGTIRKMSGTCCIIHNIQSITIPYASREQGLRAVVAFPHMGPAVPPVLGNSHAAIGA